MNSRIKKYVDELFKYAPKSRKIFEIKEEILSNVNDNYNDLIESGIDENTAYNRAIANIGDVEELIQKNTDILGQQEEYRKKSGIINAIAIGLYILCPVPVITLQNEFGVILLLGIVALATGMMIYNSHMKPKVITIDDDLYDEFIDWKSSTNEERRVKRDISSIITTLTTIIYFVVSFIFGNWHISWVIFLIGGLVKKIYFIWCDMKEDNKYESK
ncbi:MAG: permease prefix domain 1-containing protein [Peptostreptococcaceae bacterium]